MNKYTLLKLAISIFVSIGVFAQNNLPIQKNLLCKTWKLEKYKEANGKIYPAPPEVKGEYLKYNCDGTFESKEGGLIITGKWVLNDSLGTITATQTKYKSYPSKIESKIIKLTNTELVVLAKDAGGENLTLFMKALLEH
jgi:hypothetical protein